MRVGETMAVVLVLLLAIYGCAHLIQRLCLWWMRCPDCVCCCRLAVPRHGADLLALALCLQSRAAWDHPSDCRHTLLLLPDEIEFNHPMMDQILREAPSVLPVTADGLADLLTLLVQET